jgi:uncharacterized protein YmfQ (DUF2313 family)
MSRSADQVHRNLIAEAPQGWAWPQDQAATTWKSFLPLAQLLADFEAQADAQLVETNPRNAVQLLEDYERVLGPDPCMRDASGLGIDDRQRVAYQRWTARGGQSIAYFTALAASLGVAITITEQVVSECGVSVCGDDMAAEGGQFAWLVTLPTSRLIEAECGATECGMALGDFVPSLVECVIRQDAPAHTQPVFNYTAGI